MAWAIAHAKGYDMHRLLSVALFVGGMLVGAIVVWLMWLYAGEGKLNGITAVVGGVVGILLLSAPQIVLGAYLWYTDETSATSGQPRIESD